MKSLFLLRVALVPAALWADSQDCPRQNATLNGVYIGKTEGIAGGPAWAPVVGPIAVVGRVIFDGSGNLQVIATLSANGSIVRGVTLFGQYSVNRDCTATFTFGSGPSAGHFDGVITPDGRKYSIIEIDPGTVITAAGVRQQHK
jgi:hypothetical protein